MLTQTIRRHPGYTSLKSYVTRYRHVFITDSDAVSGYRYKFITVRIRSDPDPTFSGRLMEVLWIRIRTDPYLIWSAGSGSRRAKMTHKMYKYRYITIFGHKFF
jgi:hypothetical protein